MKPQLTTKPLENVTSHSLEVKRTARWFHIGTEPSCSTEVIIVLHGYGQHPAYMLNNLTELLKEGRCICAPEGLSRFYLSGFEGRVGASWMTRDDRQQEILDQINYLNLWLNSIKIPTSSKITLIGFSQGVATAARWIDTGIGFNRIVFASGTLPKEWYENAPKFNAEIKEIHVIRPLQDTLYTLQAHESALTLLKTHTDFATPSLNNAFTLYNHQPEGKHKLIPAVLLDILN